MGISVSDGALSCPDPKYLAIRREEYRRDIDGLRAVAALSVVGVHTGVLPGGFVGVDIFFVISGYLISGLIFRALARGDFKIFNFYARRTQRIFPALIALLVALSVLGWLTLLAGEYQQLGREILEGAGFVKNLSHYWRSDGGFHDGIADPVDPDHLWSLGIEEQFYLLWPLFLLLTWKLGKWQLIPIVIVTVISFALNVLIAARGDAAAYFVPWTRLWQLSLGGLLAHLELEAANMPIRQEGTNSWLLLYRLAGSRNLYGVAGFALVIVSCVEFKTIEWWPGWDALAPSVGAFLFIAAGPQSWLNRYVVGTAPLVAIGLISYPLYLWHAPCLAIPAMFWSHPSPEVMAGAVGAALLLAFLTYKYLELPLRHAQKSGATVSILCVAMLACGGFGYLMMTQRISARSEPSDVKKFVAATMEDWLPGSSDTSWTLATGSFIRVGNGSRYVLYVGDSNMQQYYPRIARILADRPTNNHSAVFAVRDWCAPTEFDLPSSFGATSPTCRAFVHDAFEYAKIQKVDAVVISACWQCYFVSFDLAGTGRVNPGADQALDGLQAVVRKLVLASKRVYIVLGNPAGFDLDPRSRIRRIIVPPGFRVVSSFAKKMNL